jgi:hypothetical protein
MNASAVMSVFFLASVVASATVALAMSRAPVAEKKLLAAGLYLRIGGGLVYLYVIGAIYGGDYQLYMAEGTSLASWMELGRWDLVARYFWQDGVPVWGTQFVSNVTGLIVYVIGAPLPVLFVVFSLFNFVGCALLARAVRPVYGQRAYERVLAGVMLFPSLWFWPSALGKDAIVLLGLGCVLVGYTAMTIAGRWGSTVLGLVLIFMIRPQVAVVVAFALGAGSWLSSQEGWTVRRIAQLVTGLVVAGSVAYFASQVLGFSLLDTDELDVYVSRRATASAIGASAFELSGPAWFRPFAAFGTTLFRPFLWEATGAAALLSVVESALFWVFAWHRRQSLLAFARSVPRSRLFWFSVVFVLVYATTVGLAVGNMGTLVRQRVHMYPFLFLLLLVVPQRTRAHSRASRPLVRSAGSPALS